MVERFPLLAQLRLSVLAFDHFVPLRLHALRPLPCISGGYTLSPCKKARNIQPFFREFPSTGARNRWSLHRDWQLSRRYTSVGVPQSMPEPVAFRPAAPRTAVSGLETRYTYVGQQLLCHRQ